MLLELLVCIENCLNASKDVFIFPYARGLDTTPDTTREALDFLGADPDLYDQERFASAQKLRDDRRRRPDAPPRRPPLQDYEEEILDALHIHELDRLMDEGHSLRISEIAKPLRDFLKSITGLLPDAFDRAFAACSNRAVPSFAQEYFNRNRAELSGLFERTSGSKSVAEFRRFGVGQRLRALYVQRRALRRRLALFRASRSA